MSGTLVADATTRAEPTGGQIGGQIGGPIGGPAAAGSAESAAEAVGDSLTVAVWTVVSRVTGVARGMVVAAVLGATAFANTYQFTNSLPNLIFYGFLGGAMLSSLLIPALVRHVDSGDRRAAERVAGGFFGVIALGAVVLAPLAAVLGPLALGVAGASAGGQARTGALLVVMLIPQVPLYGLIATASASMNAHGRFALAAAAPALENVGTVAVLAATWVLYPTIGELTEAPTSALLLLGLGTTGAVALHAAAQWFGARRAGIRLRPRAGWRDAEVRRVLRRTVPSVIQAALAAAQLLVLLVLANRVAGGVVAFQLAMNFYFLPIALGATPVALSLAPRLARMTASATDPEFRDTFVRGLSFALFLAVPAAAGYLAIAGPLARAVSYGGFAAGSGTELAAVSLAALALGVIGETVFLVATYACYAREDTATPMRAMLIQVAVTLAGAVAAPFVSGPAVLGVLGAALSAGTLLSAGYLVHRVLRRLPSGTVRLAVPVLRTAAVSALMAGPAYGVARMISGRLDGAPGALLAVVVAALLGAVLYLGGQAVLRAPELALVTAAVTRRRTTAPAAAQAEAPARPRRTGSPAAHRSAPPTRRRRPPRPGRFGRLVTDLGLLVVCVVVGAAFARFPLYAVVGVAAVALVGWVYARPAAAAYLLIALTPLTAGIDRGTVLPVLRPNEALGVLVGVALAVRWLMTVRAGGVRLPRVDRIDAAVLGLAVCSSVLPLLMMMGRGREITADDLQHTVVLWKYLAVYLIVRFSVRTEREALRCLVLSMAAASLVCLIGILQSLNLFGVPELLATFYAPFGVERTLAIGRGSSTLALAAAVADLAILNLAIAVGLLLRGSRHRVLLGVVVALCALGVLGAGEFSTLLGLLVAVATLIVVSRATRLLGYAVPLLLVGGALMWPVIETRLAGFQSASGIPESWVVRYYNLSTYFWPDLTAHGNWVLGVRPAARVPAAHEEFGWVWIESGYTWLLWGGGLPLLGAYVYFVVVSVRRAAHAARSATTVIAVVGLTVVSIMVADTVLMIFDPHLTYRGAADAMFGLLAMLRVLSDRKPPDPPEQADEKASDPLPERATT